MSERIENPRPTERSEHCPWWCDNAQPDHHTEYDMSERGDDQILFRIHSHYFGDQNLGIIQDEKNDHGTISMLPVKLHTYSEPEDAAEALQFAEWLTEAAQLLGRINSPHASWCIDHALCGGGLECYWDGPDRGVAAMHQTAKDNRYGRTGDVVLSVGVSRCSSQYRLIGDDSDDYLVSVITHRGEESATEVDLSLPEARELANRIMDACSKADADRQVRGL